MTSSHRRRLSPITQRRLQVFRGNRRAVWSLWIFGLLFIVSLGAELVANDKPIVMQYDGHWYVPLLVDYPETEFGGFLPTTADYRDPVVYEGEPDGPLKGRTGRALSKVTRDALTERIYRRNATDEREAFSHLAGGRYMCARLDKRCWLEVEDKRHRYAKNLRRYHYEWVRLERPKGDFFAWLDSRGAVWKSLLDGVERLTDEHAGGRRLRAVRGASRVLRRLGEVQQCTVDGTRRAAVVLDGKDASRLLFIELGVVEVFGLVFTGGVVSALSRPRSRCSSRTATTTSRRRRSCCCSSRAWTWVGTACTRVAFNKVRCPVPRNLFVYGPPRRSTVRKRPGSGFVPERTFFGSK